MMKDKRPFPKRAILFISVLTLLSIPTSSLGATFCVSDATELQTALTTAESNGEDNTIKIMQGTYSGDFTYASTEAYSLTVEGGYTQDCASRSIDPTNTILDGGGTDMVLALVSQGAAIFSVEGLTLQNGDASTVDDGGGLYAKTEDGTVTLAKNTFNGNTASGSGAGGGVYFSGSTATLANNTFTGNTAGSGGGVYLIITGTASLTNNTFTDNTASGSGGGVYCYRNHGTAATTLTNNTFTGNTAGGSGGGIYFAGVSQEGTVTITDNIFTGNTAKSGGGVCVGAWSTATTTLTNNTFTHNTASGSGGGFYIGEPFFQANNTFTKDAARSGDGVYGTVATTLTNNTFTGNTATTSGGGAYISSYAYRGTTLTNNTLAGNITEGEGGGVWLSLGYNDYISYLYNNIIWNNTASTAADLYIDNTGNDPFIPVTVNLFNNC